MTLRELRELKGYSQQGVADEVGCTRERWGMWERGQSDVPAGRIALIALALKVTYAEVLAAIGEQEASEILKAGAWRKR